jgi:asparagine synthase (glutamine-hydrolysing)
MCGIAGFLSPAAIPATPIAGMSRVLHHRGPDDEGFMLLQSPSSQPVLCGGRDTPADIYRSGFSYAPRRHIDECKGMPVSLAFGHRRLSIVDLTAAGHQPMCSRDLRYWMVYNGEIYNHIELREELEGLGYEFASHADTEVILAAYSLWGADCLSRFNGMWAFAIYDRQRDEVFLARDRFGIKPLYYWVAPQDAFCFASEIKSFTEFPGWKAVINSQRAYDFLVWGLTDHTDETLFSGVYQLRPGHSMVIRRGHCTAQSDGRLPTTQWYKLRAEPFSGSFEDAAAAFKQRFTDSVRLHLRADVPVGSCLSGGLDSSSITCVTNQLLIKQGTGQLQKSFSACAYDKRFDERQWIDEVVRATAVDAYYVYPASEKLFEESPAITWHQDEPFGSTSIYAQWNVFRLAADNGVKVMLDGQGADEMLGGYHSFFGPRFAGLLRSGRWLDLWKDIGQTRRMHGYSGLEAAMHIGNILLPDVVRQPLRAISGRTHARPPWLCHKTLGAAPMDPLIRSSESMDSVQGMSEAQLTATSLQMLLHWEDRDSMAHSIESRVPFLDYRLVEFVLGLPDDFKLSGGVTKRVQRAGMSSILPDRIRDRVDKLGFATPEELWVREGASDQFRRKMQRAVEVSGGILGSECADLLEGMISGKKRFSFVAWRLINFGEWMETFSVRRS